MNLLHNRNYLLLRFAWSISSFGTQVQSFAFSLYVLSVTGSAMQFSVTLCMQVLPYILFAPFSGFIADRFNRKIQVILYDGLSAVIVLGLLLLHRVTGGLPVPIIYASVFALSSVEAFFSATAACLLQAAVDPADYIKQKSVDTTVSSLVTICVPAVAGVLYNFFGLTAVLIINILSFLVSAGMEGMIHLPSYRPDSPSASAASFFSSIRYGFQYIRRSVFIRSFLLVLSALNFILAGTDIGLMTVSQNLMRLSPAMIGVENSVISVGTLASAVLCAFLNKKISGIRIRSVISIVVLTNCAAFLLIGLWLKTVYHFYPLFINVLIFMILNLIIVVSNGFLSITLSAQFQNHVPNDMMGRIVSFVNAALLTSTPLGEVVSGLMLSKFESSFAYFVNGALCAALLALCRFSRIQEPVAQNAPNKPVIPAERQKSHTIEKKNPVEPERYE